ncbi:hypothetical protein [Actinoplanes sp. L3-i22]|uniref:hypothetical protein n=1 Tax=Actinoplanes sp. L3-i22 TaxID=2836373 RepID=UPI001C78C52C|nr:hypothetical protein [Actinoplanes sp. L3-i22]BCY10631.1 hypothetical protein L3i22_057190 [Actinoplanes sp. L3-i22]
MRDEHPIDRLFVTVEGPLPPAVADALRAAADELAGRRSWVLGPPRFADGLVLSIYTARPPWGAELDREVDRAHLDEVKELLGAACRISADHDVALMVALAGEDIGEIESGVLDRMLADGLLGEWERVVNSANG